MIPEAARRLVRRTPLIFSHPLGCWLKLESLQATGSFKLRGAAVKLARLEHAKRVVAASAGNHGLGVAYAARAFGIEATVVVPRTAAQAKRDGIAALGAELILEGEEYDHAERFAYALASERGEPFISPFDDEDVIDGNGRWLGREIREDGPALRRVVAPIGGGGLSGGLAQVLEGLTVVGVQPRANCAMYESLAAGKAQTTYLGAHTVCEGLSGSVSERTFELVRGRIGEILLVEEDEVLDAVDYAYRTLGLIVEPSAAVGIAALRSGRLVPDDTTCLVITGSNADL